MTKLLSPVKRYFLNQVAQINTMTRKHPILSGIAIIVLFYIFDTYASKNVNVIDNKVYAVIIVAMLSIFYITYMKTKLESDTLTPKLRKVNITAFAIMSVVSLTAFLFYDAIFGTLLPSLYTGYNKSQILLWVLVTPISEELIFRYLFYDKWALSKFKKPIAMIIVAIFFVMLHPVTGLPTFIMYLLPTLLLFMTYDMGGIYASIAVHMIFNALSLY